MTGLYQTAHYAMLADTVGHLLRDQNTENVTTALLRKTAFLAFREVISGQATGKASHHGPVHFALLSPQPVSPEQQGSKGTCVTHAMPYTKPMASGSPWGIGSQPQETR